jgi:hypothetical protein
MAYREIGIGSAADDGLGDSLRIGAGKVNDNILELWNLLGDGTTLTSGISSDDTQVTLDTPIITSPTISGVVSGIQASATINTLETTTINGTTLKAGGMTLVEGSITDTSGAIDFGNENLTTLGTFTVGTISTSGEIYITKSVVGGEVSFLQIEGTADGSEMHFKAVDPSGDRTITFPDVTGSVITTADTNTVTGTMIASDTVGEGNMVDDAISSDQLKSLVTLLIKNSAGTTLKTLYGAGV